MVVVEDFEFQLVSAADDDANTPFKEHEKNLKTYVEVEPDAEYFLSIRKVRASSSVLYCQFYVDGKGLGYYHTFQPNYIHGAPQNFGVCSRSNGIQTQKALQFVKASFTTSSSDGSTGIGSTMAGMGEIKIEVSQGIPMGTEKTKDFSSSFTASSINIFETTAAVTMKKNLRSGVGSNAIETKVADDKPRMSYGQGTKLYTITLYYCAAPGLIAVGVLTKPPLWTFARMLHPATTTTKEKKHIEEGVVSTKNNENGKEILELNDDSDSDSDSDIKGDDYKVDENAKKTDESNDQKEKKSVKREIDI
jgi:hypothetical protein